MKKFFMNLPLKFKITIINIMIVVTAITVLGIYFYNLYYKNVIVEFGNYQAQSTDFIKNDIGLIENNITNLSTNLLINQNFQSMLNCTPKQISNLSQSNETLSTSINLQLNALVSNNYISYISVYTNNGYNFYYSKNGSCTGNPYSSISKLACVKEAMDLKGGQYWTTLSNDGEGILVRNSDSKLTMLKGILNTNNCQMEGLLIVCIDWSTVWSYVPRSANNMYFVTDQDGNVVAETDDSSKISKEGDNFNNSLQNFSSTLNKSVVNIKGQNYLFTRSATDYGNYSVISLLPLDIALQSVRNVMPMFIAVILICFVFSLIISIFTAALVTKPIQKLISAIKQVKQGDLKTKVSFSYTDEIGMLGNEYNKMIDELNRLFNKVLQLEIRNRESQIKAMQEKINPHFLYNTLDSIYIKAIKFKDLETAKMIYSLSQIFRLTLNAGRELISVSDEINLMENYLLLQKIRFKDKLDYSIAVDPEILNRKIPKLILQPFVENSIIHGIGNSTAPIKIEIQGHLDGDTLDFIVKDNGVGIPPEILAEIFGEPKEITNTDAKGFAINNVKERLRLYYGEKQSFEITSESGNGVEVKIRILETALPQ